VRQAPDWLRFAGTRDGPRLGGRGDREGVGPGRPLSCHPGLAPGSIVRRVPAIEIGFVSSKPRRPPGLRPGVTGGAGGAALCQASPPDLIRGRRAAGAGLASFRHDEGDASGRNDNKCQRMPTKNGILRRLARSGPTAAVFGRYSAASAVGSL
jgi:hypothetical protein